MLLVSSNLLWANASKGSAVVVTALVSYLGMRLWVFASHSHSSSKGLHGQAIRIRSLVFAICLGVGAEQREPNQQ